MRELWVELGATMRALRHSAGLSLRQVEAATAIGRGTLSQIENGKARANRRSVEWYDSTFGGDGALLSMFAEARGAHSDAADRPSVVVPGSADRFVVESCSLAQGEAVPAGGERTVTWRLRNTGTGAWRDRALRRVGTASVPALIRCPAVVPVPECDAGDAVDVSATLVFPERVGTHAAYWQVVTPSGPYGRVAATTDLVALFVTVVDPASLRGGQLVSIHETISGSPEQAASRFLVQHP